MMEARSAEKGKAGGCALLDRFVQEVLNAKSADALSGLFAPTFRDNHPLRIAGVMEPPGKTGSIADLRAVVNLLASPVLDMGFVLEDAFEVGGRVAYRLFGSGTVELAPTAPVHEPSLASGGPGGRYPMGARKFGLADTRLSIRTSGWSEGKILNDRVVVMYSCVGMFRVLGSQFVERWGPEVVE
jgi:hypothetical protein